MCKKLFYLCFFLLCILNARAQQPKQIDRLLDTIKVNASTLLKDSGITAPYKNIIQHFKNSIPAKIKIPSDSAAIKDLLSVSQAFDNNTAITKSKSPKIKALIDSVKQLITQLKTYNTDFSGKGTKTKSVDSAVIKLDFVESSIGGVFDLQLNIDSLHNPISHVVIKDSSGYLKALQFYNNKTPIKIKPPSNDIKDSNFKVTMNKDTLTIELPKEKEPIQQSSDHLTEPQLAALHWKINALIISIALLFFLIITGVFLFVRTNKSVSLQLVKVQGLLKEVRTNFSVAEVKVDSQTSPPLPVVPMPEKQSTVASEANEWKSATLDADPYFICEIMMTSGPRKKPMSDPNSDRDLGEDVCGFISTAKDAFVWLLDGTSDDDTLRNPLDKREYFSSRLLAQSIGDKLRNRFTENKDESLQEMIERAIEEVKVKWLQTINELPSEEKVKLKSNIENKNFPICSTTALVALLQKNGNLNAYRVGDSKIILFSASGENELDFVETTLMEDDEKGADRIFFTLELKGDLDFTIVSNKSFKYDTTEFKNINTMICFSDGIGIETEQLLKKEYTIDPVKTKREIIYQVQGTKDDKSICFIELKKAMNKASASE